MSPITRLRLDGAPEDTSERSASARDLAVVVRPVQGMPIGEQLRWYRDQQPDTPVQLELWAV